MKIKLFAGIDVGGTKISVGLVDGSGEILTREKDPAPQGATAQKILTQTIKLLKKVLTKKELKPSHLTAIGIGIPGLVDASQGNILVTPNINLSGFPIKRILEKKLQVKVAVGNDVNLGLLGEQWRGAAKGVKNVVGLFPGTGIGGAIILNGNLVTGAQGIAGELGHMIMDIEGPLCSCGNRGCLEALASRWAIERDIRQAIKDGRTSVITSLTKGRLRVIKSKYLKEALQKKDALITSLMKNVSRILGKACVSLRHIFNPEMIVLGGGVIGACGDFVVPRVIKVMTADSFFSGLDDCRVVEAQLGDDAVILGAAALAISLDGRKATYINAHNT